MLYTSSVHYVFYVFCFVVVVVVVAVVVAVVVLVGVAVVDVVVVVFVQYLFIFNGLATTKFYARPETNARGDTTASVLSGWSTSFFQVGQLHSFRLVNFILS